MGLFGFVADVVTLPIKVATAPVKILEDAFTSPDTDDSLKPLSHSSKQLRRAIHKAIKQLGDD